MGCPVRFDDFSVELVSGLEPAEDDAQGRLPQDEQREIRERLHEFETARLRGEAESHQVYVGS